MNVSNIVPSILDRFCIGGNLHVKNLVIQSIDCSKKLVLNEDSFCRCPKNSVDAPKNLFELLKRLLSPQQDDVKEVADKLAFNSSGYRISADVLSMEGMAEINGVVMNQGRGFITVGASGMRMGRTGLQSIGVVADGYQNGKLVSSENHLPSGHIYYGDIVFEDGFYKARSVKNIAV